MASEERVIEIRVSELKQLFSAIDPSPLRDRDLDGRIDEFIVDWAKDFPRNAPLALKIYVDKRGTPDEPDIASDGVHKYFLNSAASASRRIRQLFRVGRTSLVIGLLALAALVTLGDFLSRWLADSRLGGIMRETLSIGGWVAMWRPMEIFLYDWWPIRREERLFDRLAVMPVRVIYPDAASSG